MISGSVLIAAKNVTETSALSAVARDRNNMFGIQIFGKEISRVITDSRSAREGDLFVAYKGENFDGNDFIKSALDNGASAVLAERNNGYEKVIVAENVQRELEKIITQFRNSLSIPVIGITGSVGKTTVKEMISCVLSQKFNVLKTDGNLNNEIGVPLTLSRIMPEHDIAVVELGVSHPGDMRQLAQMAMPTHMVFTNIGNAHLEFLGSREGVFNEKTDVLNVCHPEIYANGDDEYLKRLDARFFYAERFCSPPSPGKHILYAMNAARLLGEDFGLTKQEIEKGISEFQIIGRRGVVSKGYVTVLDDSYNANLDSMINSIDQLVEIEAPRHVCVFGKILEIGELTSDHQHAAADYAKSKGCIVYQIDADYGCEEFDISCIKENDAILVKASRGARLDVVADRLKELGNNGK